MVVTVNMEINITQLKIKIRPLFFIIFFSSCVSPASAGDIFAKSDIVPCPAHTKYALVSVDRPSLMKGELVYDYIMDEKNNGKYVDKNIGKLYNLSYERDNNISVYIHCFHSRKSEIIVFLDKKYRTCTDHKGIFSCHT